MKRADMDTIRYVRGEFVGGPRDGEWMPLAVPPPERIAIPMRPLTTVLRDDGPAGTHLHVGSYARDSHAVCDVVVIAGCAIAAARSPFALLEHAVADAAPVLYRWEGAT